MQNPTNRSRVCDHHHHHHRLKSFSHATARVRWFPRMTLLHIGQSCLSITLRFNFAMSSSTHSRHVFLGLSRPLPFTLSTTICLHAATQSSGCLHSSCPNHLNLPCLTPSEASGALFQPTQQFCTCFPITQFHTAHPSDHQPLCSF